jgi:hypothetical protein
MKRWPTLLTLLTLLATGSAFARPLVEVEIVDRHSGRALPLHEWRGEDWVAGAPGQRYAVRLVNRSPGRVLAVLSVDGVNAVSGETASPQQAGYVLGPWQTTEVAGWRKSLSDIAAFEFTALSDSYAARTGRPDNVGVIGVAVFRERAPVWRDDEHEIARARSRAGGSASERAAAPAADALGQAEAKRHGPMAPMPQESLGTGHGAREWNQARQVAFQRDSRQPVEVHAIRYDSHRNLVAMGVIRPHHRRDRYAPDPFPVGFVADPPRR